MICQKNTYWWKIEDTMNTYRKNIFGLRILHLTYSFIVGIFLSFSTSIYAIPSTSDLLDILKTRDQQFDNVQLIYITSGICKMSAFPTWKSPGLSERLGLPPESLGAQEINVKYNEQMIVRRDAVTFIRETDPALFPNERKPGTIFAIPYTKWSNTEGKQREITDNYPLSHPKRDKILEIKATGRMGDISQEQRMEIEFACGFGFGKRIKSVDNIKPDLNGNLIVTGTILLWKDDKSTFSLSIDGNYIVRKAHIEAFVDPVLNIVDVSTSGTEERDEILFSKSGHYRRVKWSISDGKKIGEEKNIKEFDFEFKDAQFHLSDQKYVDLVNMDVPDGTYIIDKIAGISYTKGKGAQPDNDIIKRIDSLSKTTFLTSATVGLQNSGEAVGFETAINSEKESNLQSQKNDPPPTSTRSENMNRNKSLSVCIIIICIFGVSMLSVASFLFYRSRKGGRGAK
jgi:hypothetical protein